MVVELHEEEVYGKESVRRSGDVNISCMKKEDDVASWEHAFVRELAVLLWAIQRYSCGY